MKTSMKVIFLIQWSLVEVFWALVDYTWLPSASPANLFPNLIITFFSTQMIWTITL